MVHTSWQHAVRCGLKRDFLVFYGLSIFANTGTLMLPYLLGRIFDVIQRNPSTIMQDLFFWLLIYAVVSFMFWALHGPSRIIERRTAFRIKQLFVSDMYGIVKDLPMKWHTDHHSGDTINRINKATEALYKFSETQFLYITYIMMFVGPLAVLMFISPLVAVLALVSGIITAIMLQKYDKVIVPLLQEENEIEHRFASAFFDYVSNITTIISLRIGELTRGELGRRLEAIYPTLKRSITLNEVKWFSLTFCRVFIEVAILLVYIWTQLKDGGVLMVGVTVMTYQYLRRLSEMFNGFAASYEQIIRWRTNFEAVDYLKQAHLHLPKPAQVVPLSGWQHIAIQHINFAYEDKEHHVHQLKDVGLEITRGKKIALVGASGSGKSTLLGLLRGMYDCPGAHTQVDGFGIHGLGALAPLTTLIPQDPEIFENTIRYNITAGLEHKDSELWDAIETACFEGVIKRLEDGAETDIREKGVNLSGGEKQRLALARGVFVAQNGSIVLLDEPTSSVDSTTEREIYTRLFAKFKDSAIISSIHRLHLLQDFDWIYVLEHGAIIEQGTLEDLLAKKGKFLQMWKLYNKSHPEG